MATNNSTLTQERLKELFHYDQETGVFTWLVDRGHNKMIGKVAGTISTKGHRVISINRKDYHAHALAWLYVNGVLPIQKQVIRLNGDCTDNRIANLQWRVKSADREITLERIHNELAYDANTGVFRWKICPVNSVRVGDVLGSFDKIGRCQIAVAGEQPFAHRLAWLYMTGEWPTQMIDHKDGNPSNNAFDNLRDVSNAGNAQNQRKPKSNTSTGFLGVRKRYHKWRAEIVTDGKNLFLGSFSTPEEAAQAYIDAKRILHATCTI